MTSLSETLGRVWFDRSPALTGAQPCSTYLGLRVDCDRLRPNSITLWDFMPDVRGSSSRTLLRAFSRMVHQVLGHGDLREGARVYLEWDEPDPMRRPSSLCFHVLLNPTKPDVDVSDKVREIVDGIIAADQRAFGNTRRKPETAGSSRMQWTESDMVLAHDQWVALCGTYADVEEAAPGSRGGAHCPLEVFSAKHAGVGSRHDEDGGGFRLLETYVPMRRCDFEGRILFRKFLPWYQSAQLNMPLRASADTSAEQARMMTRLATAVPAGDTQDYRSVWERLMARAARARDDKMENYEAWAVSEVAHSLDGEQATYVPDCERVVNEHEMLPFDPVPHHDGTLSPFGNWVTHFLMQAEAYAWVYKQHVLLLQLFVGAMDCYRECQPGEVHFSCIMAGPPSASKSFTFTLLERLMIQGTIETATRRTENALTYSEDQGSRVMIDHELSKDFFGDVQARRNTGTSRTAQTKEILTSHKATVEACNVDDNGRRCKVRSESRAQLCYFAATNDWSTGGGCDPALVSRFYIVFPTLGRVTNKPLNDLMQHDRNPSEADRAGFERMQKWARNTQKMCYWILRLIYLKAIPDVNMDAANMVIDRFSRAWQGGTSNPRAFERVLLQARICCILTALHLHYSAPGAPRAGQVPAASHVPEMVPNMVCTAEQAKFCLAMVKSEFINSCERAVISALQKCTLIPDTDAGGNDYLVPPNVDCTSAWIDEVMMHCNPNDVTRDAVQQCVTGLRQRKITSLPFMRSPLSKFSVAPDHDREPKRFYAMRGNAIHASLVLADEEDNGTGDPIEQVLDTKVRVGPVGREITPRTVPGFPHLLQVRDNKVPLKPYVKECLFLPKATAAILGGDAAFLHQQHRRHPKRVIDHPVELLAMQARGAVPPLRPGGGEEYPKAYVKEVKKRKADFDAAEEADLDEQRYKELKKSLPAECFAKQ